MTPILVSGSTAYDYIMDYKGNLEQQVKSGLTHTLNVSFVIDEMKRESGGTGLNISYNLSLLGESSILLTSIGQDFIFSQHIQKYINLDFIHISGKKMTSSSYITSDASQNQITAFYPGAMDEAHNVIARNVNIPVHYGIIAPNKKEAMISHLKDMKREGIQVFFDPGQQLHNFSKEELLFCSEQADYLIVNDHEYADFKIITQLDDNALITIYKKIIITYGENGAKIIDSKEILHIPAVRNHEIIDTTGVGDAFRAGILKGLNTGQSWESSGKIAALLASFCLGSHGGQNHFIDQKHFKAWFYEEFGEKIDL